MSSASGADGEGARILCAGIAVLDLVFRVETFARPDAKTPASEFIAVNGGNAANAAVATAHLGARVTFAGPFGDEPNGERVRALLDAEGIDCSACPLVAGVPTPVSAIMIDPRGERAIVTYRDERLAQARPPDALALVARADALLVDNRLPDFVDPFLLAARARGIPSVLDVDSARHRSKDLMALASHVVFSAEGLRKTTGIGDLGEALRTVRAIAPGFLAVTDGADGSYWLDGDAVQHFPAFVIEAVDTLGAGDTFHGAFALRLAERADEPTAMRFASAAAALKCTRFGGITVAPTRAEVDAFLAASR